LEIDDDARRWRRLGIALGKNRNTSKIVHLYNFKDDLGGSQNLEATRPEIVGELVTYLANALHEGRTTPGKKGIMMVGHISKKQLWLNIRDSKRNDARRYFRTKE